MVMVNEMGISVENSPNLFMEKYLAEDLKTDLKNSPVIKIEDSRLIEKLDNYNNDESLIIKYSIDSPKKIVSIESCDEILDEF